MTNEEIVQEIQAGKNVKVNLGKLYEQNRGLIAKAARPYCAYCEMDDLMQEGFQGLWDAAKKFRCDGTASFATYAFHWINSSCNRYCRQTSKAVRHPSHTWDKINALEKFMKEYQEEHKQLPTDAEICKGLEISEDTLQMTRDAMKTWSMESLQTPVKNESEVMTIGDCIEDTRWMMEDPEGDSQKDEVVAQVLMSVLTKDEEVAIREVYLNSLTYNSAAEVLGCTPTAVRLRTMRAIGKLKKNRRLQELIEVNDYDSSLAYNVGTKYVLDHFTSSTEMLAFKRLDIERQVQELEDDSVTLQDIQNRLDALFAELLTDKRKTILIEKYWNGKRIAEIARELGTSRQSIDMTEKASLKKLIDDGRIEDLASDAMKVFKHHRMEELTDGMMSLKRFLVLFLKDESHTQDTETEESPEK